MKPKSWLSAVALTGILITTLGVIFVGAQELEPNILAGWQTMSPLPNPRVGVSTATDGKYIFVSGGALGYPVYGDVYSASINPDGTLTSWQATSPLPSERLAHASVVHSGCTITSASGCSFFIFIMS